MAGRNQADFRSGNLNEELGLLLLKTLAAVAPVPRQEDFGLDAVATLLRKNRTDGCLYAEESFYVQFKTASKRPVVYQRHEIGWLKGLELPFFLGAVDKEASRLELFPGHALSDVFIGLVDFDEIRVRLESQGGEDRHRDHRAVEVFLGPPLLSFVMGDTSESEFQERAYHLLKKFLQLEQRNVNARHVRFVSRLAWTTNQSVEVSGSAHTLSRAGRKEELHHACEAMLPSLQLAEMYAESTEDNELAVAVERLRGRLTSIFAEKEWIDQRKSTYVQWSNPFETSG